MTVIFLWFAWAIVIALILKGDQIKPMLSSGRSKATELAGKVKTKKEIETGPLHPHVIRDMEIEAGMTEENSIGLTKCEDDACKKCNPSLAVESDLKEATRRGANAGIVIDYYDKRQYERRYSNALKAHLAYEAQTTNATARRVRTETTTYPNYIDEALTVANKAVCALNKSYNNGYIGKFEYYDKVRDLRKSLQYITNGEPIEETFTAEGVTVYFWRAQ